MSKENKSSNGVIFHLKKSEYAEGAQKALKNAKVFISIAEFCQTQQFFDKGTANTIFAMEELAKAAYLQLKALNPQIHIGNLDSYFHKHGVKHNGLLDLLIAMKASDITAVTKPDTQEDRIGEGVVNGIVIIGFVLFVAWLIHSQKDSQPPKRTRNWQKEGREFYETIRQMSLYVEFDEAERTWTCPDEVIDESMFTAIFDQIKDALITVERYLFGSQATAQLALDIAEALEDRHVLTRNARKQTVKQDIPLRSSHDRNGEP